MKTQKVNTIEELKSLIEKEVQLHIADVDFDIELHSVGEYNERGFAYIEYKEGIFELHHADIASEVYSHDIYYLLSLDAIKEIVSEWINDKKV
jgi:hypothetical protein